MAERKEGVYLCVDKDGWTGGLQLSIDVVQKDGSGHGYRMEGLIGSLLMGACGRSARFWEPKP